MHVAFIDHLQVIWFQRVGEFGCDGLLNGSARVWVHEWLEVGQSPGEGKTCGNTAKATGQHEDAVTLQKRDVDIY